MPPKSKPKSIEETYQKLDQREHILHRPGMYIGELKKHTEELWVFNGERMVKQMVDYSPGFMKIFDEILTNATDHSFRDSTVTSIKVDFDKKTGEITVWNNGTGIPIVEHKEHKMYVPELIFGQFLSGSNYDDTQTRTGAGTNGIGSKASNVFSKRFIIETVDSENKKKFIQEFTDNMSNRNEPKITSNSGKSYTKITFLPDYKLFGMRGLEKDTILLIQKRVLDCVACTNSNVQVCLNGEKLHGKGLVDYTKYFFDDNKIFTESHVEKVNGTEYIWELAIAPYDNYEQVSFVNGNATIQGGKHVDYILYQILNRLKKMIEDKKKLKDLKPAMIKERLFLFLRATVANPSFNSQTKEQLTTQSKDFGCNPNVSDTFITKLYKSSITDEIVEVYRLKETMDLKRQTDGKKKAKVFIPKLEDALWAGSAKSEQCTLILTEGDSAKTFAMWGRSIVGPEKYGVMPLKGKCLNVRDATVQQLINNEEINNLKQIIGLKEGVEYTSTKDLRYSKIMVLTDADQDGSHIKSLIVNWIHAQWPSLIKLNFLQTLRTPIVKVIRGKNIIEFYTEQDYEKWKESGVNTSGYEIKYFKGLGTSKKEDAKETFRKLEELKVDYYYKDKKCDDAILLAFEKDKNVNTTTKNAKNKKMEDNNSENSENNNTGEIIKCSDKRKQWLGKYDRNSYIKTTEKRISYQDLINKELIHFSIYDNLRSIPSMCDGLKPSQRKILYYMLKKNITKTIKVAQLSGYVSAETSYHHGEASLQGAIINMAQDFVGTNNINLLYPDGNFGSKIGLGKDAASARYIFTRLSDITTSIFRPEDLPLLNYLNDDGQPIEPEWFIPVIPMVLINGCEGIGTGYSTFIPPYNPKDIIDNLLRVLDDKDPIEMTPWFKGFGGNVESNGDGTYVTRGKWERITDYQLKITELPIGVGITAYKEFLESFIDGQSSQKKKGESNTQTKKPKFLFKDVQNKTLDENSQICFIIEFKSFEDLDDLIRYNRLEKELKLVKSFSINNMYLFDTDLVPVKYMTTTDILLDFYDIRIDFYIKRREHIIKRLREELEILKARVRFINEYINGSLVINKRSKEDIIADLEERKYPKVEKSFDYLIRMPIISLTSEKIDELNKTTKNKQSELDEMLKKDEKDLWKADLQNLSKFL